MNKVVAFLLAIIIFVAPVTTLVKADVVIGDNDETIISENATILGRKLALMESLSDLALSGVTEFTISDTNDVDTYLDYLWEELEDAIESLSDGTGFTEISNQLKSRYFTNLVQYKDYITNRGNYLAQLLPTGSPTTTLLSTFFANNIYGKQYTQHYGLALDMFRSLSALTRESPTPSPPSDYTVFIQQLTNANVNGLDLNTGSPYRGQNNHMVFNFTRPCSWCCQNPNSATDWNQKIVAPINNTSIHITTYQDNSCSWTASLSIAGTISRVRNSDNYVLETYNSGIFYPDYKPDIWFAEYGGFAFPTQHNFSSLTLLFNYIVKYFKYVDVYVDGVLWGQTATPVLSNPTLDIDGFLIIYGNDNPQQYELQPQTKIDYDQLYQVIYNAIRDNLPISQGDINYYDSHDTIYSPTIINNYGEEEGDESDLIDTILDYAVIPKFDTAIAQPMRQALTNGVVIMNNSITNVIPNEILFILGACFFLLLFAVVINRMIK